VTDLEELNALKISVTRTTESLFEDSHRQANSQRPIENIEEHEFDDGCFIAGTVLAKLLQSRTEEDGPEIFKRVRFFTRWQDFEESRGPFWWRANGISCWGCTGPAVPYNMQLGRLIAPEVFSCFSREDCRGGFLLHLSIVFIGANQSNSKAVLFFYTPNENLRPKVVRRLTKWMRLNNSHLSLVSASGALLRSPMERVVNSARPVIDQ